MPKQIIKAKAQQNKANTYENDHGWIIEIRELEHQLKIWKDQNQESIQNFSCRNNFEKISLECYDKYYLGKIHKRLNKQNRKVQNNNN